MNNYNQPDPEETEDSADGDPISTDPVKNT